MKKSLSLIIVLILSLVVIGCTTDTVTVGQISGPNSIFTNDTGNFEVDTNSNSYTWGLEDNQDFDGNKVAEITKSTSGIAEITGLNPGRVTVKVETDQEAHQMTLEVIGENIENWYQEDKDGYGQFHAIGFLPREEKYIAAGAFNIGLNSTEPTPYAVMGETTGATYWESNDNSFTGRGRHYGIQDIIADEALFRSNHEYYLIGYTRVSGDYYQGYLARVSEERADDGTPQVEEEFEDQLATGSVYLRSGTGVRNDNDDYSEIVVVGNHDLDGGPVVPYLGVVDIELDNETGGDSFSSHEITSDDLKYNYYNLEEITTIADHDQTDSGYLIAGFGGSSRANSQGMVMTLDQNRNFSSLNEVGDDQLYSLKKVDSTTFVVGGVNGFLAVVDQAGRVKNNLSKNITGIGTIRGIEVTDNNNYLLVTEAGYVTKVDKNLNELDRYSKADSLFDITKSESGYFLAGKDNNQPYAVKIDSNGNTMKNDLD
jgi:hypothetical protein